MCEPCFCVSAQRKDKHTEDEEEIDRSRNVATNVEHNSSSKRCKIEEYCSNKDSKDSNEDSEDSDEDGECSDEGQSNNENNQNEDTHWKWNARLQDLLSKAADILSLNLSLKLLFH